MDTTQRSQVRSTLARKEALAGDQCTSTYTVRTAHLGLVKGQVVRCERPSTQHRVHEALGWVQWGR